MKRKEQQHFPVYLFLLDLVLRDIRLESIQGIYQEMMPFRFLVVGLLAVIMEKSLQMRLYGLEDKH